MKVIYNDKLIDEYRIIYNKNLEQIKEIDAKISILKINSLGYKISIPLVSATIMYIITFLGIEITPILPYLRNFMSTEFITALVFLTPVVTGIVIEAIIEKKSGFKKRD